MLRIGLIGTAATALCCFTPLLVSGLAALGLGALIPYLDIVLLALLVGFAALTVTVLIQRQRGRA